MIQSNRFVEYSLIIVIPRSEYKYPSAVLVEFFFINSFMLALLFLELV